MVKVRATRTIENALRRWGFHQIAGCDEVGRGCLAGPVVAGAVVLHPDRHIPGLFDSKMMTPAARERLFDDITRHALAWAVASADPTEIDRLNIHRASLEAMRRAVGALVPLPCMVVVDAFHIPGLLMAQRGIPKADRRCSAVAAASIVAKVIRDRLMSRLAQRYPGYGWDHNAGYATPDHRQALATLGPTPFHRRSFAPVQAAIHGAQLGFGLDEVSTDAGTEVPGDGFVVQLDAATAEGLAELIRDARRDGLPIAAEA